MEIFKYTLDPGSKTFKCPKCLRKRMVRYVNAKTLEYVLDPSYGRCNAESSCGYLKTVPSGTKARLVRFKRIKSISPKSYALTDMYNGIDFVPKSQVLEVGNGEAWISAWFIDNSKLEAASGEVRHFSEPGQLVNEFVEVKEAEPKEPSFHPLELLSDSVPDNLTKWLQTRFPEDLVRDTKAKYRLTGGDKPWEASTVFWQIDLNGNIRGGKVINYNPETGKRVKSPYPRITWMHSILKAEDFNLVQCLYGLQLVKERPGVEVALVEGEKTAIYMSIKEPDKVWLSCGSVSGLKPALLEPIKDCKITAYPDRGCFIDWKNKAKVMNATGYNIKVNEALEAGELPDGSDLLDYYELKQFKP